MTNKTWTFETYLKCTYLYRVNRIAMKKHIILFIALLPFFGIAQSNKFVRQGLRATDPAEKIKLFSQAIELNPKNLDAYFYRGVTKDNIGDYNGAILDYTKVIFFEPSADVYFNRGNSKYSLMDYYSAKEDFEKALELNPEFTDAKYSLATTKYNLNDYKGAITDLNTLPKTSNVLVLLAQSYEALNDYKIALLNYSLAIMSNKDTQTFYVRGLFYMGINYYKKANEDFTASVALDSSNLSAYFYKGVSHYLLGEFNLALNCFSLVSQNDPTDFDASIGLALTYLHLKDFRNSKSNFQKAKSIIKGTDLSKPNDIHVFENTYWFQKQYNAFNRDFEDLNNL